jgi:hypothetical protein
MNVQAGSRVGGLTETSNSDRAEFRTDNRLPAGIRRLPLGRRRPAAHAPAIGKAADLSIVMKSRRRSGAEGPHVHCVFEGIVEDSIL